MEKTVKRQWVMPSGVQIRQMEDGAPTRSISGRAIVFGQPSEPLWSDEEEEAREVIDRGAITQQLLDESLILFTMFHNGECLLGRSNCGSGTLKYGVDDEGVTFTLEMPNTADGDKALELVKRGDITGCSFAFSTYYDDKNYVEPVTEERDGRKYITYHVKAVTGIYDMTLTPNPAYPQTDCSLRALLKARRQQKADSATAIDPAAKEQWAQMRKSANFKF